MGIRHYYLLITVWKSAFFNNESKWLDENRKLLLIKIKDPVYFPAWGYASESLVSFIKRMLNKDPEMRPSLS